MATVLMNELAHEEYYEDQIHVEGDLRDRYLHTRTFNTQAGMTIFVVMFHTHQA